VRKIKGLEIKKKMILISEKEKEKIQKFKIKMLKYLQKRFSHDQLLMNFSLKPPERFVNGETFL
jgi:hypothetical protein